MKNLFTFLGTAFLSVAFATSSFAQVSATANASATIVTPISIVKTVDMSFGNIATNGAVGTVVLPAIGARTFTGGVTLPATTGTVSAASFTLGGTDDYTFSVTLPASVVITNGANTMTVNNFTSGSAASPGSFVNGAQTLKVGATLNLSASQAAGEYTSASPFTVTVNYQ
ncbi:DUF4402 domain-containing protein [Pedobacter polaris]|uniref:DUF4402 domain-containing protein n=2 Tax=Pedobacter polaris TaxID=2571273 RepID=A0A4U1CID0_9SPHI|nr:DUF4402 domain-containing protein [Pedobacter polaris]